MKRPKINEKEAVVGPFKKKKKKKNEKKNINRFEQKDLQDYEKARLGISRPLLGID